VFGRGGGKGKGARKVYSHVGALLHLRAGAKGRCFREGGYGPRYANTGRIASRQAAAVRSQDGGTRDLHHGTAKRIKWSGERREGTGGVQCGSVWEGGHAIGFPFSSRERGLGLCAQGGRGVNRPA